MRTIAVFGGTGGLGSAVVPLLEEKYDVISLGSKGVDITSIAQVRRFFLDHEIDIVINMSGKKHDCFIGELSVGDLGPIKDMLDVNIMGNINILTCCLPYMIQKGWGRVIAISSIFAELNTPKNAIYSASKAFLDRLISVANRENIKYGVTCNTIQLGYWDGGMSDRVEMRYQDAAKAKIGLKRFGNAKELYNTIDFIIENEYVCGTNLRIDGGI